MKRFMIGQFGSFDKRKQERDFRKEFFGVEACLLEREEDTEALKSLIEKDKISLGIHFPLRANQWRLRDPQYLSLNKSTREDSYNYMTNEFEFIKSFNPHYVLLHYPKPVILDDNVNWSNWRFANDTEYYYASKYQYDEFMLRSREFFIWLSQQGRRYNFVPVLELDAISRYIYETTILEELLNEFSNIKLCLDIGRLHLQEMMDKNFNSFKLLEQYAKYAEVIHLWNVKVTSNLENSHFPVLPRHLACQGWADVERYMKILRSENQNCKILFEHRSDLITDDELEECYQWVNELLEK